MSIMDYGRYSPSIDPTYLPNTPTSGFWSASAYSSSSTSAWDVSFWDGYTYISFKYKYYQVRLVRAGQ
jgi:hypothetical protein